ncbi:flavin-containing monooxygenase [Flavilitoribacter nigricans]|uniref:FAD-containing monooxygenase EthA n=1 Tax=Flavilitoribacter nigricans (strain ATCC 23147 / DSM 23189 / NBRC 102662 / NCIMB 1420 / SS-2) TaxID=1122177 RepID=A0A2D0NC80_FLAN2|nr:NAD(P)/FAD-dependent oxidoreductase [Flavilitoribacter nigricans]PHN05373.1 FAD-containing monooxygenase EthA [Flavilitoribacter nigricans DSM 23189 = NBRC 102662]
MEPLDYDIIIVGAGISGIGNAYWLQRKCPGKRIAILEARDAIGGTWSLFNYPGIRSDSDMFTFGYRFKPWTDPQALSSGASIRAYIQETVAENDLEQYIRFRHKMTHADWSEERQGWILDVETERGKIQMSTRFLSICTGYYNYKEAYRPSFPGEETFPGPIIIPQFWPQDLDYRGKSIAIVGSGATAITLVPALTERGAGQVTMVQRSPTYVVSMPNKARSYEKWQKWMPLRWAYRAARIKYLLLQLISFGFSRMFPRTMKKFFMKMAAQQLPEGYPVDKHFNPTYNPWEQRLCVVPDGDLFQAIKKDNAAIVTGTISTFMPEGIRMADGELVTADIIVLATGLNIQLLGGASISVDGQPIDPKNSMVYKGMMMSGIPNFMYSFGYTNASWTLKVDLTANYLCKLIRFMDRMDYTSVVPIAPENPDGTEFLNLSSGYIQRAKAILPKNGTRRPWRVYQSYPMDMLATRYMGIADKHLKFRR